MYKVVATYPSGYVSESSTQENKAVASWIAARLRRHDPDASIEIIDLELLAEAEVQRQEDLAEHQAEIIKGLQW